MKIGFTNDFPCMRDLRRAARDERIAHIEGWGLDDGRVFIHLKKGYIFYINESSCRSVGSREELELAISCIEKVKP